MRLGNPCAFCGVGLVNGTKKIVKFLSICHGIALCIYLAIFITISVKAKGQTVRFYVDLAADNWPSTAMMAIHAMELLFLIILWQGQKRSSVRLLLAWLILFSLLMMAQLGIIFADRSSYLLAQIPFKFLELYCFWVVWELRQHLLFMLDTREEIPMMALIRMDHGVRCMDRADGEIPPSEVDSSYERFGYQVYTSTACGYSRIPQDSFELALTSTTIVPHPAFRSYYRTCFCPLRTYHSSHELFMGSRPRILNASAVPSRSSSVIARRNNSSNQQQQRRSSGQRLLEVVSRVEKRYTTRGRG